MASLQPPKTALKNLTDRASRNPDRMEERPISGKEVGGAREDAEKCEERSR